jgi:exo-beta-1,3-glucanase (GH17 family)
MQYDKQIQSFKDSLEPSGENIISRDYFSNLGFSPNPLITSNPVKQNLYLADGYFSQGSLRLSFSPYMQGQRPGIEIDKTQVTSRFEVISKFVSGIRLFSLKDGNDQSMVLANDSGKTVMAGVDVGSDKVENYIQLEKTLRHLTDHSVDILSIGNEVLLRGELSVKELIELIVEAKRRAPALKVGYVDAYFVFEKYPELVDVCDVILINCYPFWEYCPVDLAIDHLNSMHERAVAVSNGKQVIVAETGWPSQGDSCGLAEPGFENALGYFVAAMEWSRLKDVEMYYFAAFDESWKVSDEGDVGAYWGLWGEDGQLKFTLDKPQK